MKLKEHVDRYNLSVRHLANIMSLDPNSITQSDINV